MQKHILFYGKRVIALIIAVVLSLLITFMLGDRVYPIGWIYIALFLLTGILTFVAAGTYFWVAAVWAGAMIAVMGGEYVFPGDRYLSAIIVGVQYLSAVMTGGLLGQWLRFRYAKATMTTLPEVPSSHVVLVSAVFLMILPILSFILLAGVSIENESIQTILMFIPGNTPFLFPAFITSALCGHWVRAPLTRSTPSDRKWALMVIITSYVLLAMALFLKVIFGLLVVSGVFSA